VIGGFQKRQPQSSTLVTSALRHKQAQALAEVGSSNGGKISNSRFSGSFSCCIDGGGKNQLMTTPRLHEEY